jgi:hypothetical protein
MKGNDNYDKIRFPGLPDTIHFKDGYVRTKLLEIMDGD